VLDQVIEPTEPVVEFQAGLRVAVGQVRAGDDDTMGRCLDIPRLVGLLTWQALWIGNGSQAHARMATPFREVWPGCREPQTAALAVRRSATLLKEVMGAYIGLLVCR